MSERDEHPTSVCRSDFEIATLLGDVLVDGIPGLLRLPPALSLDGMPDPSSKAQRAEAITAIRGGKHAELQVTAVTWRQRPAPNRRHLRLAQDKLADRAGSWKGKPFLVDHDTYSMSASKGTILSSKLVEESAKVASFEQVLHVVKPDAVIGFLDGTMRSFSIGWFRLGAVTCTVHGTDVSASDSCGCWPGDTVMVDGKPQVVQYEFSDYEGKEVSAVVVPAVRDTSVEGIRAALAAELDIRPRSRPPKETKSMAFTRLAAALALAALAESDEDRAVNAVTALRERAAAAELDAGTQRAEVARLTAENTRLAAEVDTARTGTINSLIADAYKSGKLAHGKDKDGQNTPDATEDLLRGFGLAAGADKLAAKISAMKSVVPIGVPSIALATSEPAKAPVVAVPTDAQLASMARQMSVPVNDLRAQYGLAPLPAGGAS